LQQKQNSLFHQGLITTLEVFCLNQVQRSWDWLIQSLKPNLHETKPKTVKENKPVKEKQTSQATEVVMKENSPATRVTRAGKRKLQTQQGIGDLPMGKLNEKGTTSQGKKLKMDEETNIHFDLDIKMEFDELEYYITSPV
jgi:hypothetical protein